MATGDLWPAVSGEIEKRIRRQQFETWFRCIEPIEANPQKIRLAVPNRFYKEWLETYYTSVIKESASAVSGESPEIEIQVAADGMNWPESRDISAFHEDSGGVQPDEAEDAEDQPGQQSDGTPYHFVRNYVFENFIVGPANRLCHASAMAVVDAPGRAYNPLFIHGGVGLGKTHLLQAACQAYLIRNPKAKIVYTSCEEFVNDFVSAVQSGNVAPFRTRLRDVDFMVIDDIHFLARAERTQEEFFHTFNSLYNAHKQIVLSSDCAPAEIPSLEERLVSRFKWGLVTRLDPPSYETRLAIVNKKSALRGLDMPKDVAEFVARSVDSNIRELEGALTRVVGYAALTNRPLDLALAHEALRDIVVTKPSVSIEDIARAVGSRFNVKLSDLQGKRRLRSIALPRQICMHVARRLTEYSLEEIGGFFGGRDHSTVLYADDKVGKLKKEDPRVRSVVIEVESELTKPAR